MKDTNLFSSLNDLQVSSAKQAAEFFNRMNREAEEKAIIRKGAEAQINSTKILTNQYQEIELMKETINALLKYNQEQSSQQFFLLQERDKRENARYQETTRLAKIATWTSVASMLVAVIAPIIQWAPN